MDKRKKIDIASSIDYSADSIVSKTILENKAGGLTLFAFDKDQRLSEHTAPFDAIVQVVEGEGEIVIDQSAFPLTKGELIIMPAHVPHAVNARQRFKMLLTMIKDKS